MFACACTTRLTAMHYLQPGSQQRRDSRVFQRVRSARVEARKGQRPSKRNAAADCPFWPRAEKAFGDKRESSSRGASLPRLPGRSQGHPPDSAMIGPRAPSPHSRRGGCHRTGPWPTSQVPQAKPPKSVLISHYSTRAQRFFPCDADVTVRVETFARGWMAVGKMGWDNLWMGVIGLGR